MLLLHLDKKSDIPLFRQVFEQLKNMIDNNIISPGEKLPPTRILANQHDVDRSTIYKAYQELWALGYIESRSGSYSYIRQRRDINNPKINLPENPIKWSENINPFAEQLHKFYGGFNYPFSDVNDGFEGIDFGRLHPDSRIYPVNEFKKSLSKIINEKGAEILDYADSFGYLPLRSYITGRLRQHGISVNTDEILITSGTQNAIDLLLKLFVKPGARIFVESPTYGMVIPALRFYNFEIIAIPMTDEGADLQVIEKEFNKGLPAFFYTMPNFHNPTGITSTQEHREKLITLCEKYKVPIVEDAFEEEMKYFGKVALPIKSMDVNNIIIYLGSFSKILFPGIRIGWVVADKECISRLATLKRFSDICSSLPEQAALADFCGQGYYELHIKKIHKIYRKRMLLAVQQLIENIKNPNVSWIEPNGGFTIWMSLKNTNLEYKEINSIFRKHKIRLGVGEDFFPIAEDSKYFRLAIASLDENEIVEGIKRLSSAINLIYNKENN